MTAPPPLTVGPVFPVANQDGASNVFTFDIRFSEEFPVSFKALRDHAFNLMGGEVLKDQRVEKPGNNERVHGTTRKEPKPMLGIERSSLGALPERSTMNAYLREDRQVGPGVPLGAVG